MLIDTIVKYCDYQYKHKRCVKCSYDKYCPGRCDRCLHFIHTPTAAPAPRKYDCPNMANFYTCKYAHKYMSEAAYALMQLKDLMNKRELKVMSVGCGPCTDLFALDYLKHRGIYKYDFLEYRGIDTAKDVWGKIHEQLSNYNQKICKAKFYYADVTDLIDIILKKQWVPDLIVFQYVFSDMEKHCPPDKLQSFILKIAEFINNDMNENTYIVINDINLSTQMGGGREHFDELLCKIKHTEYRKYHFKNNNKTSHYDYGDEYESNNLIRRIPQWVQSYEPYSSCSSAQLIIKKVRK